MNKVGILSIFVVTGLCAGIFVFGMQENDPLGNDFGADYDTHYLSIQTPNGDLYEVDWNQVGPGVRMVVDYDRIKEDNLSTRAIARIGWLKDSMNKTIQKKELAIQQHELAIQRKKFIRKRFVGRSDEQEEFVDRQSKYDS